MTNDKWFIDICANIHGNTVHKAKQSLYNASKLESQYATTTFILQHILNSLRHLFLSFYLLVFRNSSSLRTLKVLLWILADCCSILCQDGPTLLQKCWVLALGRSSHGWVFDCMFSYIGMFLLALCHGEKWSFLQLALIFLSSPYASCRNMASFLLQLLIWNHLVGTKILFFFYVYRNVLNVSHSRNRIKVCIFVTGC